MLLSLNWLHEFVPYEGTAQELGERLTMLGLEFEGLVYPFETIKNILVGQIVNCKKHPEADKLSVCDVNIGAGQILPIVCGAPNVSTGQKVPVATIGTILPHGLTIKKAKLRGVESFGMICSERELGLTDDHSGILVLPEDTPIGVPFVDALSLDTTVLKIGITPNRGDCLSILGIAREVALAFNLPLTLPKPITIQENKPDFSHEWSIHVSSGNLCSLYYLRCIENVSIIPSPIHIRYRLHAIGIRPISNIVDITNYILMELGQPLHAFDKDTLESKEIHITLAQQDETIYTLDGQRHTLMSSDLLICDRNKPIALAGIMGCQDAKVTDITKNILVECAIFQPTTVRKTARRLGISTESSYRFERGVDPSNTTYAFNRAIQMMTLMTGGHTRQGICQYTSKPYKQPIISFDVSSVEKLLGIPIPVEFCSNTLIQLGCEINMSNKEKWDVQTPSWRSDLNHQVDLIEEIIRVYGINTLPEKLPHDHRSIHNFESSESSYDSITKIQHWACSLGLNESINYSFVGMHDLHLLGNSCDNTKLNIQNPLTESQHVLRTSLIPSLLQNVQYNIAHGNNNLRLFEVAHVFTFDEHSETTVKEHMRLGIVMHGGLFDTGWPHTREDASYLDLLGIIEHLIKFLHVQEVTTTTTNTYSFLSPGVELFSQEKRIGYIGRIVPKIATMCHTNKNIWITELDLDTLWALHKTTQFVFTPLPIYPSSYRDITIIIQPDLSVSTIKNYIESLNVPILENIFLLDMFEPNDTDRNVTFRLNFRAANRTLKDIDIDKAYKGIMSSLERSFGIKI